jgi:hypothetical protein
MADFIVKNQRVLIGGYDMSGRISEVALDYGADVPENSALGDDARSYLAGLKVASLGVSGYWDGTDIDPGLFANAGAAAWPASVLASGSTEGSVAYFFQAVQAEYQMLGSIGEVAPFSAAARGADGYGLIRGTVLNNELRSTSGNGSQFTVGAASSSQRIYGALHVLAVTGTSPTLDVIIQSDTAGFSSPTTRLTFAQKNAIGAEFVSAAGPVTDTIWRVSHTIGGSAGPSFLYAVVFGIQ